MSPEEPGEDGAPEPDDASNGPPPDPLDRPWVHPSELRSFTSSTPAQPSAETRPREWAIGIGAAVAAVAATVLVLVAFGALGGRHRAPLPPPVVTQPNDVIDYAVAERVGNAIAPTVVLVRAGTGSTTRAVGSGVVVSSDRVVTTAHNLTGATDATEMSVVTDTGDELEAKLVGNDPQTDVAVLAISGSGLQLANVASLATPSIGKPVIAIAAKRGHYTVDIDVVSDRNAMVDAGTGVDVAGLLETGIRVDQDMSGGALVDTNGNLVGILTRAMSGAPDGLAIPVAMLRDVQDQLDGNGKVTHGWIGVVCNPQPADLAGGASGALVQGVLDGSPAKAAGLEPGDVVTRAGGRTVNGQPDLVAVVRSLRPQDRLDLEYVRNERTRKTTATLGAGDPQLLGQWPAMG
jgi:S1-C subfamily serine protease